MATRITMHGTLYLALLTVGVLKMHVCDGQSTTVTTTPTPLTTTTSDRRTTATTYHLRTTPTPCPAQTSETLSYDNECGSTKGCFTNCQPGSDNGPCDFMVTWQNTSSGLQFKISLKTTRYRGFSTSYLAIAFSDDYRMGDDSVIACHMYYDSAYRYCIAARPSYNTGTDNELLSYSSTTPLISDVSSSYGGYELSCTFTRQIHAQNNSRFFDLNNDYYIMLVTGDLKAYESNRLAKHDDLPWMSDSRVDFQSHQIVGPYKLFSPLVKLHGSMMVLAWVLFSWLGIMTIRYNKDMYPDKKLFGSTVWWLQVHRMLMLAVLLCVAVGFIAIFVEIGGYSQITPDEKRYMGAHPVLGIIITVLVVLNPIGAIFQPDGDHKFWWIFKWGHLGIGVVAQLLAVITIFIGYFSTRTDLSHAPAYVTAFHLFVIIFVSVFLEVRKRTVVGRQDVGAANYYGGVNADVTSKLTTKQKEEMTKPDRGPLIVLVVFSFITFGVALALLFIIALGH